MDMLWQQGHLPTCVRAASSPVMAIVQVQKSELIVGARMGGDPWELDELEVRCHFGF